MAKSKIDINQRILYLNTQLKLLARGALTKFIRNLTPRKRKVFSTAEHIILAYSIKATDLMDGIVKLQKYNLMETSQALIRVLLETYLNLFCFITMATHDDNICIKVLDSLMLNKARAARRQGVKNKRFYKNIEKISKKYTKEEIKNYQTYGFTMISAEKRAEKLKKKEWYDTMYRNFSRNVHALDLVEYFNKTGIRDDEEDYDQKYELRNNVALADSFECFFEIIRLADGCLELGISSKLNRINKEKEKLI